MSTYREGRGALGHTCRATGTEISRRNDPDLIDLIESPPVSGGPAVQEGRGYHHGDLPAALMDAAIARIAEDGTEKLSLRALARECGVSPTAPYRHFPSKRCLLAAIATRGFGQLRAHSERALDPAQGLPTRLMELGRAYVRFAQDNPTAYHLMFGSVLDDFSEYESLARASEEAYGVVLGVLEEVVAARPGWEMTPSKLGGITWAAVHGIASLSLFHRSRRDKTSPRSPIASLKELDADIDSALALLLSGMLES